MPILRNQILPVVLVLAVFFLASCAQRVSVRDILRAASAVASDSSSAITRSRSAYEALQGGNSSAEAITAYNQAVAEVIAKVGDSLPLSEGESQQVRISDRGGEVRISLVLAPGVSWDLNEIRSIRSAEFLKVRGLRKRVTTSGVGAPLVAEMVDRPDLRTAASSGSYLPVTAILEFSTANEATMTLYDPLVSPSVQFQGKERPLQADFTAPIATTYAMRDLQRINLPAMLKFDKFQKAHGIHQLDSVYPEKIPVVFVHGLKSNPDTWRDTINELREDPLIRERFEFWNFGYATGPAIPFSAMQLRDSLQQMVAHRNSLGARTDDVVVVGHSMGGLLSGLMTQSAGDENWFKLFEKPLDELDVPESDRELLRRMAYYEPQPFVRRVVFISTPHGGSNFAANSISRLTSSLIQIPSSLLVLSTDLLKMGLSVLTPIGREVVRKVPTSIDTLQSDSELVRLFREMPSNPNVIHHSIIGEKDQFVPYESTHLDEAVSEKLVPAGHDSHHHPEAIAELKRILREHAGE